MAIKEFEIKVPASCTDLRIRHEVALKFFKDGIIENNINRKVDFIVAVTGCDLYNVRVLTTSQLQKIYNACVMAFSGMKIGNPPKEIVLNGEIFEIIDPHKVASGWHIDFSTAVENEVTEKDPTMLACLFYHPKGKLYGSTDGNKNIEISLKDKYEIFKEHFPLQTFLECKAFFLLKYEVLIKEFMVREKTRKSTKKFLNRARLSSGKGR